MQNIPLFKIYWDDQDVEKVTSVVRKGMFWAIGPDVEEFEKKIAEYVGVKYAVAVNSGTSALHAVPWRKNIPTRDKVWDLY